MNNKDRIINLVKQNVISIDEALNLLEASQNDPNISKNQTQASTGKSVGQEVNSAGRNFVDEINEYFSKDAGVKASQEADDDATDKDSYQEALQGLRDQVSQLQGQKSEIEENILICQQRLKEFEIFSELDELTPDMQTQKEENQDKLVKLQDDLQDLEAKLVNIKQEESALKKEFKDNKPDFKEFINESTEKITSTANKFGEEAVKESKKFGQFISEKSKDFIENFNLKDIQLNFSFPWIKSSQANFQKEFEATDISEIDISLLNGSVVLDAYEADKISMDVEVKFYGNNEETSYELFESLSLLSNDQGKFVCHVKSPKVAADIHLKLPNNLYKNITVNLTNGSLDMKSLQAQDLIVNSKNGDLHLADLKIDQAEIEVLNGLSDLKNNDIETLIYKIFNGDLRIEGIIKDIATDTVNTNYYLTKTDMNPSTIKVSTLKGFIKLSVPSESNLDIKAKGLKDKILSRLDQVDEMTNSQSEGKSQFQRHLSDESPLVRAELETKADAIYLKDNEGGN